VHVDHSSEESLIKWRDVPDTTSTTAQKCNIKMKSLTIRNTNMCFSRQCNYVVKMNASLFVWQYSLLAEFMMISVASRQEKSNKLLRTIKVKVCV
jgi:hypothetical protein